MYYNILHRCDDIFEATAANDYWAVECLIRHYRINVNVCEDENGLTPMHICATYGHVETAKVLIRLGADLTIRDRESGWTPLHRSIFFRHVKVTLILLEGGAQLDAEWRRISISGDLQRKELSQNRDHEGLTPLDLQSRMIVDKKEENKISKTSNSLMCFGKADFILGVPLPNSNAKIVRPRRIEVLETIGVVDMVASKFHSLALSSDGRVYSWGHGRSGKLGHGNEEAQIQPSIIEGLLKVTVRAIAASENHSLAVTAEGDLYSWGSDRFGQLGLGGNSNDSAARIWTSPKRVDALKKMVVVGIAAGEAHSLCFTDDGDIYAWGSNQHGQLGLRSSETTCGSGGIVSCTTPKRLASLDKGSANSGKASFKSQNYKSSRILQIAASYNGSLVLCRPTTDNSNSCFFRAESNISDLYNHVYQWGYGITSPTKVHFWAKPGARRGRAQSFNNSSVSTGVEDSIEFLAPVSVNIIQISAGKHHNAAVASTGAVYTWGLGSDHLGHGNDPMSNSKHHVSLSNPQIVEALLPESGGGKIVSISATMNRTCAVSDTGDLYCWGSTFDKVSSIVLSVLD